MNPPLASPTISQNANQLSTTNNPLYAYQWYFAGVAISGANSSTINISQAGIYTVEIHQNGCDILSANFNAVYTGLNEQVHRISIHPNPFSEVCEISSDMLMNSISILDVSGKEIHAFKDVNSLVFKLDLRKLSNGIYFTKVVSKNSTTEHKLIIQK